MKKIIELLQENPAIDSLLKKENSLGNVSLIEEALLISAAYQKQPQSFVIVKNNVYTAQKLYERLVPLINENVLLFTMEDSLRVEAIAASPESKANQLEAMSALLASKNKICITHAGALMRYLPNPDVFQKHCMFLKVDMEISYEQLKNQLFTAGYTYVSRVDQPLCYAARGGIIDVYSMNYDHPIRIEFFDNIIESIRYFDVSTQRTIQTIKEVEIIPATPLLFDELERKEIKEKAILQLEKTKKTMTADLKEILDANIQQDLDDLEQYECNKAHLYKYYAYTSKQYHLLDYIDHPFVILSSKEEVKNNEKRIMEESIAYIQELSQEGCSLPIYQVYGNIEDILAPYSYSYMSLFVDYKKALSSQIMMQQSFDFDFHRTMQHIIKEAKERNVVLYLQKKEIEQVTNYLKDQEITYALEEEYNHQRQGIQIVEQSYTEGFLCVLEKISVYTGKEIFHHQVQRKQYTNKFKEAEVLKNYMELEVGDYVVHHQHGIGKYLGIITKEVQQVHRDFLHIAYKGDDVLLVPLDQFKLVRKFISKEGAVPKLNKLGSGDWEKTKKKISAKIAELADRLMQLYAIREDNIGYAFPKDSPLQQQFEEDFEYDLTKDQAKAVEEIKADMEKSKPMDRLLCGDVGFGKTEVAIRAAFKAVLGGKQVAFLCPTTILSHQHMKTFKKRCQNYPIEIAVLNRFISPAEQKKVIQKVKEGTIDVLIGTHRLLSKDIAFKDLGFLIIDEEQRFGVEHKEKIKELKNSVDVLSLSATPIPRTLQMSLIGIRSLSQLDTPPLNRMPVQTYVIEKNMQVIKEIIQRELSRNGQIFYLYNNIKDIYQVAAKLRQLLPDIQIGIAHGQMSREEIEDVMMKFTENHYEVLICTTIIETGIDIPNANTIIIENADCFGLSQLYQIKGRVGRSNRIAYAYLMYSPQKQLSEIAMKRLTSIKEFTQLGSGYKIAMRDLTIRGAGDMLGPQQAGFIDTVGIDMYIEMLNEAIMERKGIQKEVEVELKKANAKVDAYIPDKFTKEDYEKLTLYQRIEEIKTKQQLLSMMEELQDNYGRLPKAVQLLFEKKRLDILINEEHVQSFIELDKGVEITFCSAWSNTIDGVKLFEDMTHISKDIRIRYADKKIIMKIPKSRNWLETVVNILEVTK